MNGTVLECTYADFGTWQVLENGDVFTQFFRGGSNKVDAVPVFVRRTMGEIEAEDIDAGLKYPVDHLRRTDRGAHGANDFGTSHRLVFGGGIRGYGQG